MAVNTFTPQPAIPTSYGFTAGKNAIINGDFAINQRGFTSNTADNAYNFDRWLQSNDGGTFTVTPQTFTVGTAPVAGYEGKNFLQGITASQTLSSHYAQFRQKIESVRTFAGQTVTVSFWAKAGSGTPKVSIMLQQNFGTGGSPSSSVNTTGASAVTLSTSWARYSTTISVPSISGKTIGTANNDFLGLALWVSAGTDYNSIANSIGLQNGTFQFWGIQVEAGSVATAFQTATGTIQGELAACQRYYWRISSDASSSYAMMTASAFSNSTTQVSGIFTFPVEMRAKPTSIDSASLAFFNSANAGFALSSIGFDSATVTTKTGKLTATISGGTAGQPGQWVANATASGYLGLSAEL
jgi:hypothetical protein